MSRWRRTAPSWRSQTRRGIATGIGPNRPRASRGSRWSRSPLDSLTSKLTRKSSLKNAIHLIVIVLIRSKWFLLYIGSSSIWKDLLGNHSVRFNQFENCTLTSRIHLWLWEIPQHFNFSCYGVGHFCLINIISWVQMPNIRGKRYPLELARI